MDTRENTNYETWYSEWAKRLALTCTFDELLRERNTNRKQSAKASDSHRRAVEASTSMTSQSMRRAHTGNVTRACGDELLAIDSAIQIYDLFPEHTKEGVRRVLPPEAPKQEALPEPEVPKAPKEIISLTLSESEGTLRQRLERAEKYLAEILNIVGRPTQEDGKKLQCALSVIRLLLWDLKLEERNKPRNLPE